MKLYVCRIFLSAMLVLTVSACSTTRSSTKPGPTPLVVSSCPELTPLADDSFGTIARKLVEVAGIYHECREAALAGKEQTDGG